MIIAIFFLAFLHIPALAQEQAILNALPLDELQSFADDQDFDLRKWIQMCISGEIGVSEGIHELTSRWKEDLLADFSSVGSAMLIPSAALLVMKLMLPSHSSSQKASMFVCRVSCISALAAAFVHMREIAEELLHLLLQCTQALTPVMLAAVSLAGGETAAAFLNPTTALCAELIQNLLRRWGVILTSAAAMIAIAGNLSENFSLKRLYDLFRHVLNWGAASLMTGFIAILSIQGKMSAGRDSMAARTAKYAIEGIIPVIGGSVSDSLDALLSTAFVVKNAVGISGLALIAALCFAPMLRMLSMAVFLRVISAILEPLGDNALTTITIQFANCVEMLLVISIAAAVLCGLLTGSCMSAAANVVR